MDVGVSKLYSEEGQIWLQVSPGHSVSEGWLEERAPDLYAQWWAAPSLSARDQLALQIEDRLDALEPAESWELATRRYQQQTPASPLADRVSAYERDAARLGELPFDDRRRSAGRAVFQRAGGMLRDDIAGEPAGQARELMRRRLDAADLIADRPFIEALAATSVDRLATAVLAESTIGSAPTVSPERVLDEMIAEDPHAALRADVLLAVSAAGRELSELQEAIARHGVDLRAMAPDLVPASDFYARHAPAIEARLDREILAGGYADLPSYVAAWPQNRPLTRSLHDTEQALVEHVVGSIVLAANPDRSDLHDATRMRERATDRAELREWSAAVERGELTLLPSPAAGTRLELNLEVDHDVEPSYAADREVS